ncbi:MAG: preprotein translocase subunit SecA, partial [Thermoanaerobaculia bacterium]
ERHESRRIDNQLRGRSGRQGDPGESRFYLSLEDDLMRLFATGAMNWVMGKAFPDDLPLEAKMVTKAIERAQRTVEDRNFEIRKDVLKYDEVMNEQRKVIYKRRQQILDGGDLREETVTSIEGAVGRLVDTFALSDYEEEWEVGELLTQANLVFPTRVTKEQVEALSSRDDLRSLFLDDAIAQYEAKEQTLGNDTMREIERRVMLSVIDQHWREHLYEMDYLREGINLRAMGQRDPLAEWQREGYDMFEAMMGQIQDNFVSYVFHLEVVADDAPARPAHDLKYSAPDENVQGANALRSTAAAMPPEELADLRNAPGNTAVAQAEPDDMKPVRVEKTPGRNEPCYCGSGKKYKLCHGR